MSIAPTLLPPEPPGDFARHPNELDLRRVSSAILARSRYRYVEPKVEPALDGYLVRSACCSRNVDPDGGEIDVAMLRWDEGAGHWLLLRKDHKAGCWIEDSHYARLPDLLLRLNADPHRRFWQ